MTIVDKHEAPLRQRVINFKYNYKMQLTKAEEQIMQILWDMETGLVKDIRDSFSDPKPARNTVSTVLRVLEKKGYVGHKAIWKCSSLLSAYFKKRITQRVSFSDCWRTISITPSRQWHHSLQEEKDLTVKELDELLEDTKKELSKTEKQK